MNRCYAFGRDMVERYRKTNYCTWYGVELDPVGQALAKMGECVGCVYFGVSLECLDWRIEPYRSDGGNDIYVWGIGSIDIKWTRHYGGALVWPVIPPGNNEKLKDKKFDLFMLVQGVPEDGFDVVGWVTRLDFLRNHKVAPPGDPRFKVDTWYMDQPLNPMEWLSCKQIRSSSICRTGTR